MHVGGSEKDEKRKERDLPAMRRPIGLDRTVEQRENNWKAIESRSRARVQSELRPAAGFDWNRGCAGGPLRIHIGGYA